MSHAPDPRAFYTETLPEQWNRALRQQERAAEAEKRLLEGMRAANATLCATVAGEAFHLVIREGRLAPADSAVGPPLVTLVQEQRDFERLIEGTGGSALGFLGVLAGLSGELKLTRAKIEALSGLSGGVRFEIGGDDGFALLALFGEGAQDGAEKAEPDTTIRIGANVYSELRAGRIDAPNAFMTGQIELDGNAQLAMQLALAVLSPD